MVAGSTENSLLVDVVVTQPACPSHREEASHKALTAADNAAKAKKLRYVELISARKQATGIEDHFSPFACEVFGGLHKSSLEVIKQIAHMAEENLALCPSSIIKKSLLDSVAINIQRGNALIMIEASSRRWS